MLVKDINFKEYSYKRICVNTNYGTKYFPEDSEESVLNEHGNDAVSENGVSVTEAGWLSIQLENTASSEPTSDE